MATMHREQSPQSEGQPGVGVQTENDLTSRIELALNLLSTTEGVYNLMRHSDTSQSAYVMKHEGQEKTKKEKQIWSVVKLC